LRGVSTLRLWHNFAPSPRPPDLTLSAFANTLR
jgi:hypothetical protein